MGGKQILVVDEDRNTALLYQRELAEESYTVTTAFGCTEAIRLIPEMRPNLVLVDVCQALPEARRAISRLARAAPGLRIVMHGCPIFCRECRLDCPVDVFVEKSQDLGPLKRVVRDLLGILPGGCCAAGTARPERDSAEAIPPGPLHAGRGMSRTCYDTAAEAASAFAGSRCRSAGR